MKKRNAIIMAAGTSSRFVPLSAECPKGLVEVKGEVLIERQIRQLIEAGITDISLVVGSKADMFDYLRGKYGVKIVLNEDFARYNNTSSLIRVIDKLNNTFVCSSDNYFPENVFLKDSEDSYYSTLYAEGDTNEYCVTTNADDYITDVRVGGRDAWYMVGHVFFNQEFSEAFRRIMIEDIISYIKKDFKAGVWYARSSMNKIIVLTMFDGALLWYFIPQIEIPFMIVALTIGAISIVRDTYNRFNVVFS